MTKQHTAGEIRQALANTKGDITAAAASLGMKRAAIYYRIGQDPSLKQFIEMLREHGDELSVESIGQVSADVRHAERIRNIPESVALSTIGRNFKRQQAGFIAANLNDFIKGYGLPRDQAGIFDVIDFLERIYRGKE